jgi:hypothetical protein
MIIPRVAWCKSKEEVAQAENTNILEEKISPENENTALSMLLIKLSQIQKTYKTTIEV